MQVELLQFQARLQLDLHWPTCDLIQQLFLLFVGLDRLVAPHGPWEGGYCRPQIDNFRVGLARLLDIISGPKSARLRNWSAMNARTPHHIRTSFVRGDTGMGGRPRLASPGQVVPCFGGRFRLAAVIVPSLGLRGALIPFLGLAGALVRAGWCPLTAPNVLLAPTHGAHCLDGGAH